MNKQEQEAIERIKESLKEFDDSRYVQHVMTEDLKLVLRLLGKNAKK